MDRLLGARQETAGRHRPVVSTRSRRAGWAALALALPAPVLAAWPPAGALLQFDRAGIVAGELWRVITAHWTHWSLDHLAWDLLAFGTLTFLGWRISPQRTLATILLSALTISAVVLDGTEMRYYRGLSGIDSALFVLVAFAMFRRTRGEADRSRRLWIACATAGFAAKVAFEILTGGTVFADSSTFVPVPLVHVVGGLCGAVLAWTEGPAGTLKNRGIRGLLASRAPRTEV